MDAFPAAGPVEQNKQPANILEIGNARSFLEGKLAEYESRRNGKFNGVEVQLDSICKGAIIQRLLKDGNVDADVLKSDMMAAYGENFNEDIFQNAWGVIKKYNPQIP